MIDQENNFHHFKFHHSLYTCTDPLFCQVLIVHCVYERQEIDKHDLFLQLLFNTISTFLLPQSSMVTSRFVMCASLNLLISNSDNNGRGMTSRVLQNANCLIDKVMRFYILSLHFISIQILIGVFTCSRYICM